MKTVSPFVVLLAAFAGIKALHAQTPKLDTTKLPTNITVVPVKPYTSLILPPVEYDHHYEGDLTLQIIDTFEELYALCAQKNSSMLACSYPSADGRSCLIIMVNDLLMRRKGWTTGLLFRHEQGHCNGWAGDHPGQRRLSDNTTYWVPDSQRVKVPLDRVQRAEEAKAAAPR
jgi:hypothetical protein